MALNSVSSREQIVIIGSGIIGLAHAVTAREAGYQVTVIDRDTRPVGASVRNFGTIWPIGLAFGPEREQGLWGMKRWRELAPPAGFTADPCGSLSVAYREEAWSVLTEFSDQPEAAAEGFTLLTPEETLTRFPLTNPDGLKGALLSPHETCVRPAEALNALVAYARSLGVEFELGACVIKVHEDAVELADGRFFPFGHCVIAAGEDMKTLFPAELSAAGIRPCRLQMMRSEPIAGRLGAIMVSDLTLAHYPAFSLCPSLPALKQKIAGTMAAHLDWGVHVIAAQHADGSLTLGDSHEYGGSLTPDHWSHVDKLVLENLASFTRLPDLKIASRWHGTYLKSTLGQTQVILQPRERVTMVTAMGGLGMTLSWGLARRTVASWGDAFESVGPLL
ncbi:MAG: TIGR03364 family FAD-dependent oxidoreductase [Verrucomicrobiota bacterium]